MAEYVLEFPDYFDAYAGEIKAKGCFGDAVLAVSGRRYRLNFYDPVRLAQTIEDHVKKGEAFFEVNLVVVEATTRSHMENAAAQLVRSQEVANLVADVGS